MSDHMELSKIGFESGTPNMEDQVTHFSSYTGTDSQNDGQPILHVNARAGHAHRQAEMKQSLSPRRDYGFRLVGQDFFSKVNDGLAPATVLIVLTVLYDLVLLPIERSLNISGMLIFVLLLLALGAIMLDGSITARHTQTECAFRGMLSGLFFWFSANTVARLAPAQNATQSVVMLMLMVTMIIVALWKTVFPIGVKFFTVVFLLNWIGRFLITNQLAVLQNWNTPMPVITAFSWIALICVILLVVWLFVGSKYHIQRSWTAIGIWFCGILAISLFLGWPL